MTSRLRLLSGLVLLVFLVLHQIGLAMGLVSIDAMDAAKAFTIDPWRTAPGTALILAAIVVHLALSLWSIYARTSFRVRAVDAVQLMLGLAVPALMAVHFIASRVMREFYGLDGDYRLELAAFWVFFPVYGVLMPIALVVAWAHGCIGLHMWLRLKPWYRQVAQVAYGTAVALPTLALAGYVSAGIDVLAAVRVPGWLTTVLTDTGYTDAMTVTIFRNEDRFHVAFALTLLAILLAMRAREALRARFAGAKVYYGGRVLQFAPGATVLEVAREHGIAHPSVCGGRGRCSTCRVKVGRGADWLAPPTADESGVLARISAPPGVRLACQIRPRVDLEVTPMLPPTATAADGYARPSYLQGEERGVAIVFVDLRDSTSLSEGRLPYDFVFVLNQFFTEIDTALEETGGLYAQFNGDGLMALYGLESGIDAGSFDAIRGAVRMLERIDGLNEYLTSEVGERLRIGIGVHAGNAIVGSMGPPSHPIVSAIGDNVNIAARLESETKARGVPLIVSGFAAEKAGVDLGRFASETVEIRGLSTTLPIFLVDEPERVDFGERSPPTADPA